MPVRNVTGESDGIAGVELYGIVDRTLRGFPTTL
jgi:hypothetical protein